MQKAYINAEVIHMQKIYINMSENYNICSQQVEVNSGDDRPYITPPPPKVTGAAHRRVLLVSSITDSSELWITKKCFVIARSDVRSKLSITGKLEIVVIILCPLVDFSTIWLLKWRLLVVIHTIPTRHITDDIHLWTYLVLSLALCVLKVNWQKQKTMVKFIPNVVSKSVL